MKREVMADVLDDFIVHINKIHEETHAATAAKLRRAERLLYGTLALATCSVLAVVVMAVTQ
jgi:predicted secreted Zn-dependent protease